MATRASGDGGIELQHLEILDETAKEHGYNTFEEYVSGRLEKADGPNNPRAEREFETSINSVDTEKPNMKSFWYDEDDPEMDCDEVEEFDEDDMTEMAHAKLEEIKEMRHYQRLAVWELPLLSSMLPQALNPAPIALERETNASKNWPSPSCLLPITNPCDGDTQPTLATLTQPRRRSSCSLHRTT